MIEPNHNEEEPMITEKSADKNEISNKRNREETSDSEKDLPLKKARTDKESSSIKIKQVISSSESNNDVKELDNDQNKDINIQSKTNNVQNEKVDKRSKIDNADSTKSLATKGHSTEENSNDNDTEENEKNKEKESDKHDSSLEKEKTKKDQSIEKREESEKEMKKTKSKKKNEESEIINGVELTVECASDDENLSEESIKEEDARPRTKTIIVREQPNDSEVDASSSEAEKSDSYQILEAKSDSNNETTPKKPAQKRGRKKSSVTKKAVAESESNTEDEDYSPVVKKKVKKSPIPKKTIEAKRGRGRPRGRPSKNSVKSTKELSEDESEKKRENSSDETEEHKDNKTTEKAKDSDKADSKTGDSAGEESDEKSNSESDNSEDVKKGKQRKPSKRNIQKIKNLKKYIRATGVRVPCYATLLKGCETDAAKAKRLTEFLQEQGVLGRPSLEKCNKIKVKNETLKEIQELDTSSIISETRSTRGKKKSQIETKVESKTPTSPDQKASETFKRIKAVADSDSE